MAELTTIFKSAAVLVRIFLKDRAKKVRERWPDDLMYIREH